MVNASLVVLVGKHLGDVVGAEFIFTRFFNHADRGQVSQYSALDTVSIINSDRWRKSILKSSGAAPDFAARVLTLWGLSLPARASKRVRSMPKRAVAI